MRNSLVIVSKKVEMCDFTRIAQVQKGQGAVTSMAAAVLPRSKPHLIPQLSRTSITSQLFDFEGLETSALNGFKVFKCGVNRSSA